MTTLSVIMPNFNHAHYLPQSLEAILGQSFKDFEVIFIDDASSDNSIEIIQNYQKRYPQIKIIRQEINAGPVVAMNVGINAARGEFIALCAVDDEILPGFFEESISLLKQYPQASLCTSNFCSFKEDQSHILLQSWYEGLNEPCFLSPPELFQAIRKHNFWIPSNASIIRRSCLEETGIFKDEIKALCDWFLCLVMAFRRGICYIPKALTTFRFTATSYSVSSKQSKIYDALIELLESAEFSDVRSLFLQSGIFFQLDKAIFPYLLQKSGYRRYVPRIFMQKVRQKIYKNKYKKILLREP